MLVRITNHCRMGCSHCMVNADENGEHMSLETFKKVLEFNASTDFFAIFLSGGEPLDHPDFFEIAALTQDYIKSGKIIAAVVMSNGMFLDDPDLTKKVIETGLPFQITNDPEFYPKKINEIDHPNFKYEHKLRLITPMERALKNNITCTRQSPMCFNLRSHIHSKMTFQEVIVAMRASIRMCTPSINIDGSIVAGEAPMCCKIGTIHSSPEELANGIKNIRCGKCGLYKNLMGIHREYWNIFEGIR